jgi:hypothetical protein
MIFLNALPLNCHTLPLSLSLPFSRNKKEKCSGKGNLLKMSGGRISLMWNKAIEQAREML